MKKRLLMLTVALIMLFTVACNSTPATSLLSFIDTQASGKLDLEGSTFYFLTGWDNNYHIPEDYKSIPSELMEIKNERFLTAEKEFNINFEFIWEDAIQRVAAGYGAPELLDNDLNTIYNYYKAGMIVPMEEIDTIDLDSGMWGSKNFIKYGNFNGKQYGIYPINWMTPETTGAMMYNGSLVKALGGTVPYEYRENGTWTWETFENELKKYPLTYADTPPRPF